MLVLSGMEQMTLNPSRRLQAHQAYGRAVNAFEPVAWRPPSQARFEPRVANDVTPQIQLAQPRPSELRDGVPSWVTITFGGLIAALAGALLGGALHI